jgi:hypothetical protein
MDGLAGIAIEGLAPHDQLASSCETVEIADLVSYYGKDPTFKGALKVVLAQLKYSIGASASPFCASDGAKTFQKFASALRDHKKLYSVAAVERKLEFELITNRPVHPELSKAIRGLASGQPLKGKAKRQADQIRSASGLGGQELAAFARKLKVTGLAGSLKENKQQLSRVLADWSAAPDAMARARLGAIRDLLREKAGSAGKGRNVIRRTDVLDALELQSSDDLFPCPESFPKVGKIVQREQLKEAVTLIPGLKRPLSFMLLAEWVRPFFCKAWPGP